MKTLVLIPAHNEAKNIVGIVKAVVELGYDVLVVDDGSVDDTAILAKTHGARVLSTYKKSGKGSALQLGFSEVLARGYEAVITMDGDGQHAPSDIANFVEAYQKSRADIINGNRMANPSGMPLIRRLTNGFMSWLISLVCRQQIADTQCGFRLITSKVLEAVTLKSTNFEIETEILIQAGKKKFHVVSVPIQTIYRDEISKIHPLRDTLRFVRYFILEIFRR